MGTWFNPTEMHEQWEEFQRKHWKAGESISAELFTRVKDSWDNGYANGHKEIKNGDTL